MLESAAEIVVGVMDTTGQGTINFADFQVGDPITLSDILILRLWTRKYINLRNIHILALTT